MCIGRFSFVLCGAALVAPALGQDAYSDFGPGNSFSNNAGWDVSNVYTPAFQFQSTMTGALTGFEVAMGDLGFLGVLPFTLKLYTDPGGAAGTSEGLLLGSWSGATDGTFFGDLVSPISVAASGVTLTAGSYYWLEASGTHVEWDFNSIGANNPMLENGSLYNIGFLYDAAYSVQLTPAATPEPFTVGLGIAGVALAIRRRITARA